MPDPTIFLCISTGTARKAGLHSTGTLSYAILKDADSTDAYFIVTGNSSAGYYSREAVPLARIEACLAHLPPDSPIQAKSLRPTYRGKSANDSGFLLALLRQEGLVTASPDTFNQNIKSGDWPAWRQAVLAKAGEPFECPVKQATTTMSISTEPTTAAASITDAVPLTHKGRKPRKDHDARHAHPSGTAGGDDHDPVA